MRLWRSEGTADARVQTAPDPPGKDEVLAIVDARGAALRRAVLRLNEAFASIDPEVEPYAAPPEAADALDRIRTIYAEARTRVAALPRRTRGRLALLSALAQVDRALDQAAGVIATPPTEPAQVLAVRNALQAAFDALDAARKRLG